MEWVKLYGILFDKEAEAETFFNEQVQRIRPLFGAGYHRQNGSVFLCDIE